MMDYDEEVELLTEIDRLRAERDAYRADLDAGRGAVQHWCEIAEKAEARLAAVIAYIDHVQEDSASNWDTSLAIMENIRAAATGTQ